MTEFYIAVATYATLHTLGAAVRRINHERVGFRYGIAALGLWAGWLLIWEV